MPCFYPVDAWRLEDGRVVFAGHKGGGEFTLPCGSCRGCRLDYAREWAVRCVHEAQCHASSYFVTLTYRDDVVPRSLTYAHFQHFMRRLRKRLGTGIRFYMCGEYGGKYLRPHFHACIFGLVLPDLKYYKKSESGFSLYTSDLLERLWTFGFCPIGHLTFESASYTARYCMKKVNGDMAPAHYLRVDEVTGEVYRVRPEFARMSLRPGLGQMWFEKFKDDCLPRGYVVVDGRKGPVPRYYRDLFRKSDPFLADEVDFKLYECAMDEARIADRSPERLAVREQVLAAGLSFRSVDVAR